MKKVIVAFDEVATQKEVEILKDFIAKMAIEGVQVDHLGGGIKNPKN